MTDPNRTQAMTPGGFDPNKTQLGAPPTLDPHRTIITSAPSLNATQTIKPVQCPVCRSNSPVGVIFCVECGLIFDKALPEDAFGAPAVQVPVLIDPAGREHPLRPGATIVGRQGDIAVDDASVSRKHAQIDYREGALVVKDLGSTNGTKVNGEVVAGDEVSLQAGDELKLGSLDLKVAMPGEGQKTLAPQVNKTQAMTAKPSIDESVATLVLPDRKIPLTVGRHTFGRRTSNDIVISDPYVSGEHGAFHVTNNSVTITDTGSTNGTVVNDAKLPAQQATQLSIDDVVRLGQLEIRVEFRS